ncbi:SNF2 family N-terminal domain-containing protein [Paraphysoderma sedebokerense]|nr:SNF2 family N-terminal domain-containing protein [Paraphysoderma sedebokerense]
MLLDTLKSDFRILLTGTPVQNNIDELFSILNFVVPAVLPSREVFGEWFDFTDDHKKLQTAIIKRRQQSVLRLRQICSALMLRREKTQANLGSLPALPSKTVKTLLVSSTNVQNEFLRACADGGVQGVRDQMSNYVSKIIFSEEPEKLEKFQVFKRLAHKTYGRLNGGT